jgi:HEAT repeat protein
MLINFYSLQRIVDTGNFLHLLGDESSGIRLMALNKLSNFLSYDNLKPYMDKLVKDESPKIRTQVLKNLGNFGRDGLSYLKVMAEDKEPAIASRAMAYTRNAEYLPRIQKIILDESSSSDLVIDLTMAISGWNNDSGKFVYSLLDNPAENRRYAGLSALRRQAREVEVEKLLKLIKDDSSRIRQLVFTYVVRKKLNASAVSQLALSEYSDVREFTLNYILRNYGRDKEILESLYDLMLDEELKIRAMAIQAVWECKTEDRYEILEQSLTDSDGEIRNLAAQLLLSSPDPKAKAIMDEFIKKNKKVDIKALKDLNKIANLHKVSRDKPANWRAEIIAALKSDNKEMQQAAVDVIIKTRDSLLVDGLRNYLDSTSSRDLQNYLYKKLSEEEE